MSSSSSAASLAGKPPGWRADPLARRKSTRLTLSGDVTFAFEGGELDGELDQQAQLLTDQYTELPKRSQSRAGVSSSSSSSASTRAQSRIPTSPTRCGSSRLRAPTSQPRQNDAPSANSEVKPASDTTQPLFKAPSLPASAIAKGRKSMAPPVSVKSSATLATPAAASGSMLPPSAPASASALKPRQTLSSIRPPGASSRLEAMTPNSRAAQSRLKPTSAPIALPPLHDLSMTGATPTRASSARTAQAQPQTQTFREGTTLADRLAAARQQQKAARPAAAAPSAPPARQKPVRLSMVPSASGMHFDIARAPSSRSSSDSRPPSAAGSIAEQDEAVSGPSLDQGTSGTAESGVATEEVPVLRGGRSAGPESKRRESLGAMDGNRLSMRAPASPAAKSKAGTKMPRHSMAPTSTAVRQPLSKPRTSLRPLSPAARKESPPSSATSGLSKSSSQNELMENLLAMASKAGMSLAALQDLIRTQGPIDDDAGLSAAAPDQSIASRRVSDSWMTMAQGDADGEELSMLQDQVEAGTEAHTAGERSLLGSIPSVSSMENLMDEHEGAADASLVLSTAEADHRAAGDESLGEQSGEGEEPGSSTPARSSETTKPALASSSSPARPRASPQRTESSLRKLPSKIHAFSRLSPAKPTLNAAKRDSSECGEEQPGDDSLMAGLDAQMQMLDLVDSGSLLDLESEAEARAMPSSGLSSSSAATSASRPSQTADRAQQAAELAQLREAIAALQAQATEYEQKMEEAALELESAQAERDDYAQRLQDEEAQAQQQQEQHAEELARLQEHARAQAAPQNSTDGADALRASRKSHAQQDALLRYRLVTKSAEAEADEVAMRADLVSERFLPRRHTVSFIYTLVSSRSASSSRRSARCGRPRSLDTQEHRRTQGAAFSIVAYPSPSSHDTPMH